MTDTDKPTLGERIRKAVAAAFETYLLSGAVAKASRENPVPEDGTHQPWEYTTILIKGDLLAGLNVRGKEGWELAAILEVSENTGLGCLFKRRASRIILPGTSNGPAVKLFRG